MVAFLQSVFVSSELSSFLVLDKEERVMEPLDLFFLFFDLFAFLRFGCVSSKLSAFLFLIRIKEGGSLIFSMMKEIGLAGVLSWSNIHQIIYLFIIIQLPKLKTMIMFFFINANFIICLNLTNLKSIYQDKGYFCHLSLFHSDSFANQTDRFQFL